MNNDFTQRLKEAFEFASMAEIARRIDVPHATVRNYFHGRMPAPEVLIKIASQTNISINWLLTGVGPKFVSGCEPLNFDRFLAERVTEIVERMLNERGVTPAEDIGLIDEAPVFDVEAAMRRFGDPQEIMRDWFRYEGREYPADFGVVFFKGWEGFTEEEKLDAVRDAKNVLDRTLRFT